MVLKKGLSFIITLALLAFAGQASAGPNANATVSLDLIAGGVVHKTASGEFAGLQLHLDTQIETPAASSNRLTISEKKAGDTIQLQLFAPMAAGKQTYGYEIELDLPGKTFSNYIGSISGKDFTGASLFPTPGRPILSSLLISTPVVPANGYLGQIDLQVINTLEAETTLIVKAASMAGLNRQQDPLDVSNAVITFTVISHPGDFDGDLDVDFADFLAFVGVFGLSSSDVNYDTRMDMNSDGAVNFADFLAFVGVFGRTYGQPTVDQIFDLSSGSIEDFRFTVDTNVQQNVILQGEFSVENGTIQMAVLSDTEYQIWLTGGTPRVLYSPGETSGETFRLPIYDSDTYYIIFRNTGPNTVTVKAAIFLLSTPLTAGSRVFEPEGLVLIDSGNRFFRYFQGRIDASGGRLGHLRVPNGGLTPKWSIHFLDEDGNEIHPPDNPDSRFTWTIFDNTVVEVYQNPADVGKFEFQLRGLKIGETAIQLQAMHGDRVDFRTIPIPVHVVDR